MPTYEYACTECGHDFEQFQSFSEDALTVCPQCEGRLRKVYNAVGVVFKGSGFYRNDSRTDGQSGKDGGTADGKPDTSGGKDGATSEGGSSSGSDAAGTTAGAGSGSSSDGGSATTGTSGDKAASGAKTGSKTDSKTGSSSAA